MRKPPGDQSQSLNKVARAAGVPVNTLRRHVKNFPDFLPALITALERQSQALEHIAKELSQIRQGMKKLAKKKNPWDDDLPF
jgi:AcrR family transcriptional regulator